MNPAHRTSSYAIASLVCGLVGFASCPLVGVVAIGLYFPAMSEVYAGVCGGPSKGFAIAGLVMGIINVVITLMIVAFIATA